METMFVWPRRSGKRYLAHLLLALTSAADDAHVARCPAGVTFQNCQADWCTYRRELLDGRIPQ